MAVTSITPISLVLNTATVDHADANATAVTAGADGFSVVATNLGYSGSVLFKFVETGGNAGTVTFTNGVKPPSMRAGLAAITVALAASDVKYVSVEEAQVTQADGTIKGLVTGAAANTVSMSVFILPRNL